MAIQTVCDIFYRSVDTYRKPEHLKYKKDGAWRAISSEELRAAVEETSMGLRALGIGKGDVVAILSENRPEWAFADLATLCAGAADATIYATLTPPQVQYILERLGVEGRLRLERGPGGEGRGGARAAPAPPARRSASTPLPPPARRRSTSCGRRAGRRSRPTVTRCVAAPPR